MVLTRFHPSPQPFRTIATMPVTLQRWSIFDGDAMPMFSFFLAAMRCQWFWPLLTIAIGAIIFSQLSGPIIF